MASLKSISKSGRSTTSSKPCNSKTSQFGKRNSSLIDQSEIYGRINVMANIRNPDICMSVQLSEDGKHYAVPLTHGQINIYNSTNDNIVYKLNETKQPGDAKCAATSVRFRPWGKDGQTPNNFLIATFTNGSIKTFHFPTLSCVHELNEKRATLACAYSKTADTFATSGDDGVLRIYDDETRRLLVSYIPPLQENAEFQRAYSIEYHPGSTVELITGGWDDTVRFYDLRIPHLLKKLDGPHICGEGIAFSPSGREFCTASWRKGNSVQIWDYSSSKLIKTLDAESLGKSELPAHKRGIPSRMNYACKYFDENRVVLGGTQDDAMSLASTLTGEVNAAITGLTKSVYAVDSHGTRVAFVAGNEVVLVDIYLKAGNSRTSSVY